MNTSSTVIGQQPDTDLNDTDVTAALTDADIAREINERGYAAITEAEVTHFRECYRCSFRGRDLNFTLDQEIDAIIAERNDD